MSQQHTEQTKQTRFCYISNGSRTTRVSEGASSIGQGAGALFNGQTMSDYYVMNHFGCVNPHGFMAEAVCERRYSLWWWQSAKNIGTNNRRKGPDLLVDSVQVQVKYCNSPQATVDALINKGVWEYKDGVKLMDAEVASDKCDGTRELVRTLIKEGRLEGVTDPDRADSLIRRGPCSYAKAVEICKPGTLAGLTYDAQTGIVSGAIVGSMSFILNVWHCLYDNRDCDDLIQTAAKTALRDGAIACVTHIVTAQVSRTAYVRGAVGVFAERIARSIPTALQRSLNRTTCNQSLNGAGVKHLSKILRGTAASTIVLTLIEIGRTTASLANGTISTRQAGHNTVRNVSALCAGCLGWHAGFTASALLFPGSSVLAFAGAFLGSSTIGLAATKCAENFTAVLLGDTDDQRFASLVLTASLQIQTESFLYYQPTLVASLIGPLDNEYLGGAVRNASGPEQQYNLVLEAARAVVAQWEHVEAFVPLDAALTGLQKAYYLSDAELLAVAQQVSDVDSRAKIMDVKDREEKAWSLCLEAMKTLPYSTIFDHLHKALVELQSIHDLTDYAVTALGQAMATPKKRGEIMGSGGDQMAIREAGEAVLAMWQSLRRF